MRFQTFWECWHLWNCSKQKTEILGSVSLAETGRTASMVKNRLVSKWPKVLLKKDG